LKDSFTPNLEDAAERHDDETLDEIVKAKTFLQKYHNPEPLRGQDISTVPGDVGIKPDTALLEEQLAQAAIGAGDLISETQAAESSSNAASQQAHYGDLEAILRSLEVLYL
jgi:hypothetical protein